MTAPRILVIDDVATVRGFVKAALRELHATVAEASDGHQALEMQSTLPADLIVCDLDMPGTNGEAFVRILRERGDPTPVIVLTAEGDKAVVDDLVKLGIQGYVLKPFRPALLCKRAAELIAAGRARQPADSA